MLFVCAMRQQEAQGKNAAGVGSDGWRGAGETSVASAAAESKPSISVPQSISTAAKAAGKGRANGELPPLTPKGGNGGAASSSRNSSAATSTKLGPNSPCPCGSGQKYKKCHMAK
eukprot:473761-Prorocentrum_minimum.AAC.1